MTMYFVAQPSHLQQPRAAASTIRLMSRAAGPPRRRNSRTFGQQQQQQQWLQRARILRTCYLVGALACLACLCAAPRLGAAAAQEDAAQLQLQQEQRQRPASDTERAGGAEQQQQQQQVLHKPTTTTSNLNDTPTATTNHETTPDAGAKTTKSDAPDQLHRLMSDKDLRRTFHVERHDQVPEYQILKLSVARDGSHLISPISDLGELLEEEEEEEERVGVRPQLDLAGQQAAEEHQQHQRVKRSSQEEPTSAHDKHQQLLVVGLSTFGRDFSLRLKRNADFQQRIKDMKMFLAESLGDGQLKYTEIKPNHHHKQQQQQQQQHHKQEPHKRAASASEVREEEEQQRQQQEQTTAAAQNRSSHSAPSADAKTTGKAATSGPGGEQREAKAGRQQTSPDWLQGATAYHDEANLAAVLVERDSRTGQLRLDGTIGNDFVIKPMPRATLEALAAKQRQEQQQQRSSEATSAAAVESAALATLDLERSASSAPSSAAAGVARAATPTAGGANNSAAAVAAEAAHHLHDDDPHDDDEMFLDEDEALELAHLQASAASVESNHTTSSSSSSSTSGGAAAQADLQQQQQQLPQQAARTLTKAASERKWRKYRKLLAAQTQVPKLAAGAPEPGQRARRHAHPHQIDTRAPSIISSHHIVFRQRPSSEASSDEHQHSFMLAPGQQSMEAMARRFPAGGGRGKRDAMIDANGGEDAEDLRAYNSMQSSGGSGGGSSRLSSGDFADALDGGADFAHDPLGGQFYLEPASVTGYARAGYADWSLVSRARALPPYALNATTTSGGDVQHEGNSTFVGGGALTNGTAGAHARYKRHARQPMGARGATHAHQQQQQMPQTQRGRRHKRQAPDVVWPEVLLVVDYDSFLLHGGDSREVKRYFVSFWNGVDLRYKLLVNPHIRISLAGMIVAKDRDATPYLERNRLRAPNADAVDAAGALTDMGKYLYREDRLPTYDLAVVITKLDMCRRRVEHGRCNRGTAGFAYVGGACVVNKRLEKVNSVAIIEDSGGFSGIIVAAHEVGHLLGCVHDGSPPPSYLGGPGATHCPWEQGFIMSDLRHTERGFRWSQCSVEQFKHFLNGETATCLYNYPHESQMLNRLLPGHMLSLDDQCKRDRGTNACFKDARVCAQLFCFDSASGYCVSYRPAAEGSPCGDGHTCRNGKCVSVAEMENIIPDYTHQSQTVVAAGGRGRPLVVGGPAALLPPARLADNGLSASSTSTATSSPDATGKASSAAAAAAALVGSTATVAATAAAAPQISSRMDVSSSYSDAPLDYNPTTHLLGVQQQPINYNNNNHHHQQRQAVYQQQAQAQYGANMKSAKVVSQPQARTASALATPRYATTSSLMDQHPQSYNLQQTSPAVAAVARRSAPQRRQQQSLHYQQQQQLSTPAGLLTSASDAAPLGGDLEHSNLFLSSASSSISPLHSAANAPGASAASQSRSSQPPAIAVNGGNGGGGGKKRHAQLQQSSARQLATTSSAAQQHQQRPNYRSSAAPARQPQSQSLDHHQHHYQHHSNNQQPSSHLNYDYYNRHQQQQHLLQTSQV